MVIIGGLLHAIGLDKRQEKYLAEQAQAQRENDLKRCYDEISYIAGYVYVEKGKTKEEREALIKQANELFWKNRG